MCARPGRDALRLVRGNPVEHVVFFPGLDGSPAYSRVGTLDEAVKLVERLRNDGNLADFSVHAMTPVPLSVRAYYRVEAVGATVPEPRPEPDDEGPFLSHEPEDDPMDVAPVSAAGSDTDVGFFVN